jgi:signal peptidase I
MSDSTRDAISTPAKRRRPSPFLLILIVLGLPFTAIVPLVLVGLIRLLYMPTHSMEPTISPGDHVFLESFTFLIRKPRLGDLVVFTTEDIPELTAKQVYLKRIAGRAGDHIRISSGELYVNGQKVKLSNALGEIRYQPPKATLGFVDETEVVVPDHRYYVLGDNSTNSYDSRYGWFVPERNVRGRIALCCWPLNLIGLVH